MKKITLTVQDVEVKIIKFVSRDVYEDFGDLDGRNVENVASEIDEIDKLRVKKPIAFFKQNDGSYLLVTQKASSAVERA
ncbi:MAG: hypothetical protein ABIQ21_22215 [Chryseolinea sp.]